MFCSLQSPQPSDWSDSECGGNYVFGRDQSTSSTGGALVGYITPIPQIACKLLQRSYGLFTVRCASGGSVCRNTDLQKNLVAILSRFFCFGSMIGYARKRAGSTSCKHMTLPVLIYTTSDVVQDFHQYQEDETTWIILKYPELRGHLLTAWMRNWVAIKLIFDPVEPVQVSREFFGRHDYIYIYIYRVYCTMRDNSSGLHPCSLNRLWLEFAVSSWTQFQRRVGHEHGWTASIAYI